MKFLKILIILIFFLFPFGELLRIDIGNNIAIKPLDIVVGLAVGLWIIFKVQSSKFKVQSYSSKLKVTIGRNLLFSIATFFLIGLFSLIINLTWLRSDEFFVSLLYLLRWAAYAGIFFVVSEFDKKFKKLIGIFLFIDGLLILLFGYLQYFFYNNLRNLYYLGWDEHLYRMFSTFLDPNFAGGFLVLFFLFTAGILTKYKVLSIKYKGFLLGVCLLTLGAIFLTFSRSAILMLIVSSAIFLILINKKQLIFVLLGIILLFVVIASPKFYNENMNLFRSASSTARLENYSSALQVIKDHPIIGVGFNSYRYTKDTYGLDPDLINVPSHAGAGVDNSFLFVLATTGIVGLSAYIYLWYIILKQVFNTYQKNKNISAIVVLSSSVGLFVDALFINSLFFAPFMLWMWVLFAMLEPAELRKIKR